MMSSYVFIIIEELIIYTILIHVCVVYYLSFSYHSDNIYYIFETFDVPQVQQYSCHVIISIVIFMYHCNFC